MRIIEIKNDSGQARTYAGKRIMDGETHRIGSFPELEAIRKDEQFIADITNQEIEVGDGGTFFNTIASSLDWLFSDNPRDVTVYEQPSFTAKVLPDGSKLFRRKHGAKKLCPAGQTTIIDIEVPYVKAKITKAELINCVAGDCVDLFVLDTGAGAIQISMGVPPGSAVPNAPLNQFGFDVVLPNNFYEDASNYDADLIQGMVVRTVYKNEGEEDVTVGVNITFHEVK